MDNEIIKTMRTLAPFLLSHHPDCSFFDNDVFQVSGKRICLGCSIAYPTAVLLIILSIFTGWYRSLPEFIFHQDMLFCASLLLGSLQFIKYQGIRSSRTANILVKASLGLSLGGITVWIFTTPIHFVFRIVMFIVFFISLQFVGTMRFRSIRDVCSNCIYHGDWDICYGFRDLNRYHDFSHVDRRGLERLIFDKKRKQRMAFRVNRSRKRGHRIDLRDASKRWVYHDKAYDVPWLPGTGSEVSRYEDILRIPRHRMR
ncbi:MAG: hypothetical protein JW939_08575 [Candidatus Thermoplasmatota archaeon]|nr:hypothetical protein [Candidatus Thermoplasmatota archaeon]